MAFVAISIAFAPLGTQACMAYQRSPASFARGRAEIRVRFAEPRPLAIARTGAPTAHVAAASELDGRTFGTRGDTIYLEPTRVVLAGRELPGLTLGAWTTIVLREGDRLEVRRPAPGRVVARVFGAIALLWFLVVITYDEAT